MPNLLYLKEDGAPHDILSRTDRSVALHDDLAVRVQGQAQIDELLATVQKEIVKHR